MLRLVYLYNRVIRSNDGYVDTVELRSNYVYVYTIELEGLMMGMSIQ